MNVTPLRAVCSTGLLLVALPGLSSAAFAGAAPTPPNAFANLGIEGSALTAQRPAASFSSLSAPISAAAPNAFANLGIEGSGLLTRPPA